MDLRRRSSRPAFTLVELLIVIGIISLLIAISVVMGVKVVGSGKARVTEGIIKALDQSLTEYVSSSGSIPSASMPDPRSPTGNYVLPVADAMLIDSGGNPHGLINSVGLYMQQAKSVPAADSLVRSLNPKYVHVYDPDAQGLGATTVQPNTQPPLLTVFDGWGNPIRYVHPAFQGMFDIPVVPDAKAGVAPPGKSYAFSQIRRIGKVQQGNPPGTATPAPDADSGIPLNNRPYFYSMGPDGKAGYEYDPTDPTYTKFSADFNKDNIFVATPRYAK